MTKITLEIFDAHDVIVLWKKDNILYNFQQFKDFFVHHSPNGQMGITVKNDLYGAPLDIILPLLSDYCHHFFVATLQEAIEARQIFNLEGQNPNIYLLHGLIKGQENHLIQYEIIPCINNMHQLNQWTTFANKKYVLHLDTGMSRHGISIEEAKYLQNTVNLDSRLMFYMSHFYGIKEDFNHFKDDIDNSDSTHSKQVKKMQEFLKILPPKPISFSATDSAMAMYFNDKTSKKFYDLQEDIIRPGIGIIGGVPTEKYLPLLRQSFSVYAKISSVSHIEAGQNIGYGIHSYDEKKIIAVINIGYGDGYMKILTGQNVCLHYNGKQYLSKAIAINLNCSIIDITHLPDEFNFEESFVEVCGESVDIRKFAINDGCYQVYSGLGSKGKNKKTLCI